MIGFKDRGSRSWAQDLMIYLDIGLRFLLLSYVNLGSLYYTCIRNVCIKYNFQSKLGSAREVYLGSVTLCSKYQDASVSVRRVHAVSRALVYGASP